MKIAILGSTGFVGRELLKKSLEKGYQIRVLVRNNVKAVEQKLHRLQIDCEDLVNFILEQSTSDTWLHKAPLVCSIKK